MDTNWREEISKLVEALAVNRKAAIDFGASREEVDEYLKRSKEMVHQVRQYE